MTEEAKTSEVSSIQISGSEAKPGLLSRVSKSRLGRIGLRVALATGIAGTTATALPNMVGARTLDDAGGVSNTDVLNTEDYQSKNGSYTLEGNNLNITPADVSPTPTPEVNPNAVATTQAKVEAPISSPSASAEPKPPNIPSTTQEMADAKKLINFFEDLWSQTNTEATFTAPGDTGEAYVAHFLLVNSRVQGDGSKVFTLKEGDQIITKNGVVIMATLTPKKGEEPNFQDFKEKYGEPEFIKKGASDPKLNLGPAGTFAFFKAKDVPGGFAVMIDGNSRVKEVIATTNNNYTQFLGQWGKLFLAPNGKAA